MATQLAETAELTSEAVVTSADETVDNVEGGAEERDYEAEARQHGWTPKDDFKGDPAKWVDAETFAKRADEVMPFLKKQNTALKREMDDLKRTMKQASAFYSKAEERAYERALADLQARHDEAVEGGDVAGARKVLKELHELEKPASAETEEKPDTKAAQQELADWVDENDWYINDEKRRAYADIQAGAMGPAAEWEGGPKAWLEELGKRVTRKFADPKPNPVNGGGNRPGGKTAAHTFSDLPPEAKAAADKFFRNGVYGEKTQAEARAQYAKDYDWS